MTSLSEHRKKHLVQANIAMTQHESEAARYEVEAVRDRLVRRLSTHVDKTAAFYQHADLTGRPATIHRAELYMFNVEQLKEHERKVRAEVLEMIRDEEDRYGIGSMSSSWTGEAIAADIADRLTGARE